jgi:hypothetical protein
MCGGTTIDNCIKTHVYSYSTVSILRETYDAPAQRTAVAA